LSAARDRRFLYVEQPWRLVDQVEAIGLELDIDAPGVAVVGHNIELTHPVGKIAGAPMLPQIWFCKSKDWSYSGADPQGIDYSGFPLLVELAQDCELPPEGFYTVRGRLYVDAPEFGRTALRLVVDAFVAEEQQGQSTGVVPQSEDAAVEGELVSS
jgi:hypothetical protein